MNTVNPFSDFEWHRSSFCASGACVEVAVSEFGDVLVSDSKLGKESPVLSFTSGAWARALENVRNDWMPDGVRMDVTGSVEWGRLQFTESEWHAFVRGVRAGEFDFDELCTRGVEAGSGEDWSGQAATGAGAIAVPPVPVAAQPRYILDKDAVLELVGRYAAACVEAATSGSPKGREGAREQIRDLWDAIRGALTPVPASEPIGYTDRGFPIYADFIDEYGSQVRIQHSSAALGNRCWIFIDSEDNSAGLHASPDQVRIIRDALSAWLNAHEPTSQPAWGSGPLVKHVTETPAFGPADIAEYLNPTGAPAVLNCAGCGSGEHEYCVDEARKRANPETSGAER